MPAAPLANQSSGGYFPHVSRNQERYEGVASLGENEFMLRGIWEPDPDTEGGGYVTPDRCPNGPGRRARRRAILAPSSSTSSRRRAATSSGSATRATACAASPIPDGGRKSFTQYGGYLQINGLSQWDPYDTVLAVQADPAREGYLRRRSITATASAEMAGFPAANLVDCNYLTYWDANRTVPVTIDLDLGGARRVAGLAVNQREWSPTYTGRPSAARRTRHGSRTTPSR